MRHGLLPIDNGGQRTGLLRLNMWHRHRRANRLAQSRAQKIHMSLLVFLFFIRVAGISKKNSLDEKKHMRLIFYQPLLWLRMLKLIQQMYMRNDALANLVCNLHWQHGLSLRVRSEKQDLCVSVQANQFKCWDVPQNLQLSLDHLPLDYMLTFLQRYEALMLQKFYVNVGLVWEWKFDLPCHSSPEQTLHNVSWGPNSTAFRMLMRRNDDMQEMDGTTTTSSNNAASSSSNGGQVNGHGNGHTSQDNYGDQVINPQILFGQRIAESSSSNVASQISRHPVLCTYWHDVVRVSPYNQLGAVQAMTLGGGQSSAQSSQFKVITEELKRMLNEWLLLSPRTCMQFNEHQVSIEAGDVRAVHAHHTIPYAAKVFVPMRVHPHQLVLDTLSLMDLHRFLHCFPNDWGNHVLWKVNETDQTLTWQVVPRTRTGPCGVPELFQFSVNTRVLA